MVKGRMPQWGLGHFTKPHIGHLLWEYAEQHDFTDGETSEVWAI